MTLELNMKYHVCVLSPGSKVYASMQGCCAVSLSFMCSSVVLCCMQLGALRPACFHARLHGCTIRIFMSRSDAPYLVCMDCPDLAYMGPCARSLTLRCAQDVKSPNILIREQVSGKRQVIAKLGAHHQSGMLQLEACLSVLHLSCEFRVTIEYWWHK